MTIVAFGARSTGRMLGRDGPRAMGMVSRCCEAVDSPIALVVASSLRTHADQ
jgi:hypothetical protein